MKTLLLSSLVGLTLVATSASASAAVNVEQNSVWKRSHTAPVTTAEKTQESEAQVWRRIRFSKVDVTTASEEKKVWRRIRF